MDVTALTPAQVLTLAGASIVVSLVMAALLSALQWTDAPGAPSAMKDRFGPLLALVVGVLIVGGFAIAQGAPIVNAILTGLLAGGGSKLVHDGSAGLGLG